MKVKRGCLRGVGGRPAQVKGNTIASGGVSGDFYGVQPPLLKFLFIWGAQPTEILALAWLFRVYWSCFQSAMINCGLLYCY